MKIFLSLVAIVFAYFYITKIMLRFHKHRLQKKFKRGLAKGNLYLNSSSVSFLTSSWLAIVLGILFVVFLQLEKPNYIIELFIAICLSILFMIFTSVKFIRKIVKKSIFNFDTTTQFFMYIAVAISVAITVVTFLTLLIESIKFFKVVNIFDFFFGKKWYPDDFEFESSKAFGILPLIAGTFVTSMVAIFIALPIGVLSAIYISEYASNRRANIFKSVLEVLSGVPTIVYGYFAAFIFSPFFVKMWDYFNMDVSFESAFNAAIVIGIMIIPYITSLCFDVFRSMPPYLRFASFAMGSTKYEMVKDVLMPYSKPKLYSIITLALSRAIGETMIVVMCAGLAGNLSLNPFESLTTFTVQIVELLVGDSDLSSIKSKSAFALAMALFLITLLINSLSMFLSKRAESRR